MRMSISTIDSSVGLTQLSVDSALGAFTIRIEHSLCRDSMSGLPHPDSVSIDLPDRQLRGCGGDPHALLRSQPWRLASAAEAAVWLAAAPLDECGRDSCGAGALAVPCRCDCGCLDEGA